MEVIIRNTGVQAINYDTVAKIGPHIPGVSKELSQSHAGGPGIELLRFRFGMSQLNYSWRNKH